MADLDSLISTRDLKTDYLMKLTGRPAGQINFNYDASFDALVILFVSPDTDTFVHYIDDEVALVCKTETLQVVGFQIESFAQRFMPQHESVKKLWRLKVSDLKVDDLGDLLLVAEQNKLTIAREIVRVTQTMLRKQHDPLNLPMPDLVFA